MYHSSKPNKKEKEKDSRAKEKSSVNVKCQECGQLYHKKIFDRHSSQCSLLQKCFKKDVLNELRIPNANISQSQC